MTRDNLELALKLNNDVIIQEINLIVDYVNDLASDQKITNYELERSIKANSISGVSDRLEALETTVTNNFHDINEDYSVHKNNSAIHVTQSDKDNWNSSKTYTDQELSDHASNKNLHVTKNLQDTWNDHVNNTVVHVVQSDKDYWNSILNISKQYAKQLFDSVTSINLIKCEELPEEDIQELTIYMLKVSEGSEEENDLYDEYMYIDGEWERIGSTRVNLEDYVTKTLLQTELGYINQSITAIQQQLHSHTNINILNKLSEDNSGNLLYDNNKISAKSSMSEIIDINITNLSNGDTLKYNSTNQKWENKPDNVLEIDDASTSNSKLWSSNKTNTEINKSYKDTDSTGTTIADNDYFPFYDTSASDKKKSTWSNVKSVLKTYFDTLYNNYSLPIATSSSLGGVLIGEEMTIDNNGKINPKYLVVANKFNKRDLYSTSETIIGCWIDGRPIYQKVIYITIPTCTTDGTEVSSSFAIGASINEVIYANILYVNDGKVSMAYTVSGAINKYIRFLVQTNTYSISANRNKLRISNASVSVSGCDGYAIIQYTKTTDTANSFNYANENDYSTNEQIIGKWIDGSNLYQKTFTGTLPNITDGTYTNTCLIEEAINPNYTPIKYEAFALNFNGGHKRNLVGSYADSNDHLNRFSYIHFNSRNNIMWKTNINIVNGYTFYVTVQYIKT